MARIRVCTACRKPESECLCPGEDDEGQDGSGEEEAA